jgi:hypothetical protein
LQMSETKALSIACIIKPHVCQIPPPGAQRHQG